MEGGGEDGHPGEAFGLQLGPDSAGVGIGGCGVADDQLHRDVAGSDGGQELAVATEHRVRVRFVANPGQRLAFEHRHRVVVAGDGGVEDCFGESGLVGERLVDGLHGDARGGGDGGHGRGGEAVAEEQADWAASTMARRVRRACSCRLVEW